MYLTFEPRIRAPYIGFGTSHLTMTASVVTGHIYEIYLEMHAQSVATLHQCYSIDENVNSLCIKKNHAKQAVKLCSMKPVETDDL